ncbi:MAG: anhydro-N-acetylmuramic acid kinase [Vulcanimicrobiaceae bacterium]
MIALGIMSGTSLDGIDVALVDLQPKGAGYRVEMFASQTAPMPSDLAQSLQSVLAPREGSTRMVAELHQRLGRAFAEVALEIVDGRPVDFVASHGQTLWHDGARSITLQVGDPFLLREALHATVCYDFRSADCAAGGHGAPLVPYVDALLLGDRGEDRIAVNLGGVANLTALPRRAAGDPSAVLGFDVGPANLTLDAFVQARTGHRLRCDVDGALAAAGRCDAALLDEMLADPYFAQMPPKSTGREHFGAAFLDLHARRLAALSTADGAATLTELVAASLSQAIRALGLDRPRVLCSGGGVRNPVLLARIAARLPDVRVESTAVMGIDPDAKEAVAFAVLGYETLRGRPANLPSVTGARHRVVLGGLAPYDLSSLLAKVAAECRG